MPNIVVRAIHSIGEGTFRQKLAVRRRMVKVWFLERFDWLPFYLGKSPWQCAIKAWYFRRWGAQIGSNLFMERCVAIKGAEKLRMGNHVGIGSFSLLTCDGGMIIEDYVNISVGCRVLSSNHKVTPVGEEYRYGPLSRAPVHLKKGCWLATTSIVLPGVTVGEGAVVIAGSLVTKDVPPYAYVGGVPAKFIMYREGYKPPAASRPEAAVDS